jgi:hypothetical protein
MEEQKDIAMILLMHTIKWIDKAWFGCAWRSSKGSHRGVMEVEWSTKPLGLFLCHVVCDELNIVCVLIRVLPHEPSKNYL